MLPWSMGAGFMENDRRRRLEVLEMPSYGIPEAAGYLLAPTTTLRAWFLGQHYETTAGLRRRFAPPLRIAQRTPPLLSFLNLVEAHVLGAVRRQHGVTLQNVRKALGFLEKHFPSKHPLADRRVETQGLGPFFQPLPPPHTHFPH